MTFFTDKPNRFTIAGPSGELELLTLAPALEQNFVAPTVPTVAIICHPHPLFGGNMHNKVVYTLATTFKQMGLYTVRFNFRGVQNSAGDYSAGIGETEDVLTVLTSVKQQLPTANIWLAGFSFGSYVAARAAAIFPITQLISIAPPVHHFNFATIPTPNCRWLVVQGEQDEIVPPEQVYAWIDSIAPPPTLIRMPEADHFFHGRLVELRELLQKYFKNGNYL